MSREEIVGSIGLVLAVILFFLVPPPSDKNPFIPESYQLHPPQYTKYCTVYMVDKEHPANLSHDPVWNGKKAYSVACTTAADLSTIVWSR